MSNARRSFGCGLNAALRRLVDRIGGAELSPSDRRRIFDEGRAAGRAKALAEARRQEVGDGPDGFAWEWIVRHAAANRYLLSTWEKELVDSVDRGPHYGIQPSPRQKAKLEWVYYNRLGGRVP